MYRITVIPGSLAVTENVFAYYFDAGELGNEVVYSSFLVVQKNVDKKETIVARGQAHSLKKYSDNRGYVSFDAKDEKGDRFTIRGHLS